MEIPRERLSTEPNTSERVSHFSLSLCLRVCASCANLSLCVCLALCVSCYVCVCVSCSVCVCVLLCVCVHASCSVCVCVSCSVCVSGVKRRRSEPSTTASIPSRYQVSYHQCSETRGFNSQSVRFQHHLNTVRSFLLFIVERII